MRLVRIFVFAAACALGVSATAAAQGGSSQMSMPGHQMSMPANPLGIDHTRDGSGTSWLPDASPMQGLMHDHGSWMLMLHGNAFLQYIKTGGDRGDDQFGSINWIMGMAQRPLLGGQLQLRAMLSLEPATVTRCGYPLLLQSGELCNGEALHDRQHPHDLFMELAASYRREISNALAFEVYGGPSGEPALGPTAFAHRLSAMPNPLAPIAHHWLDSSHISFGVVTGGIYDRMWKAEVSAFNGREPDDARWDIDLAALDSYSGRFWLLPSDNWAIQVSAGHLKEAEATTSGARADVDRFTASATYHRMVNSRIWATTVAIGRNRESNPFDPADVHATSAFLAETALDLTRRDTLFLRGEIVGKTAEELSVPLNADETFTVGKLQFGYTRWLTQGHGIQTGIGGSGGVSFVPEALQPFYGGATSAEVSVFFTIRPR